MPVQAALTRTTSPSSAKTMVGIAMSVTTRCSRACASPISRSAAFLSLMSRKTRMQPCTRPCGSRIGAALSSIGVCEPSRRISKVWFARPTTTPSRSARVAGFSTGSRVDSLTMRKTASSGWPFASSARQPVSDSATRLRLLTRPSRSVAMTASPMLSSVTRRRSPCAAISASARRARAGIARARSTGRSARRARPAKPRPR